MIDPPGFEKREKTLEFPRFSRRQVVGGSEKRWRQLPMQHLRGAYHLVYRLGHDDEATRPKTSRCIADECVRKSLAVVLWIIGRNTAFPLPFWSLESRAQPLLRLVRRVRDRERLKAELKPQLFL